MKKICIIIAALIVLLLIIYVNHQVRLKEETELRLPLGQIMGVPQVPMLLFISDGSGGTGFDKETWRKIPIEYLSQVDGGKYRLRLPALYSRL